MTQPTHPGQMVRHIATGKTGITTDYPAARSPRIAVMWVGGSYPVYEQLEDVEKV